MPSKKRKYNARFPAGRIKKIMQTDEEVGKVAQAVPIIISRTLELFVESLLGKALQVTTSRNAKTLSPSHVKQTILAETKFDFLRDLVKNIPDVSAAEEKELMSAETSPNSSRFNEACALAQSRRIVREDSTSSNSEVIRVPALPSSICSSREQLKRALSLDSEIPIKTIKLEPAPPPVTTDPLAPSTSIKIEPQTPGTSLRFEPGPPGPRVRESIIPGTSLEMRPGPAATMSPVLAKIKHKILTQNEMTVTPLKIEPGIDTAIDLSIKDSKPANFYQETLVDDPHRSVIKVNPTYSTPSTSYTKLKLADPVRKIDIPTPPFQRHNSLPALPRTPITPVINIDFSKNICRPEIKVLDVSATTANIMSVPRYERTKHVSRQNSKPKMEVKKIESKPAQQIPVDIDSLNSGNLQIDEDYDT